MLGRFEAHMTFDKHDARRIEATAERTGWVYSVITGCPILGQGTYCYLTNYNRESDTLLREMREIESELTQEGIKTLRSKIENIVYDSKTGVNEIEG